MNMRMFLVEKGKFVVIRNARGAEISFGSFDEFYRYCPVAEFGIDLTGVEYLDYEPSRIGYIVAENNHQKNRGDLIPVREFESIIDNIEVVMDRKTNPFFGASDEERWEIVRNSRNLELQKSDWTQLPDTALPEGERVRWKRYRHELRGIPQKPISINNYDRLDVFVDEEFPVEPE